MAKQNCNIIGQVGDWRAIVNGIVVKEGEDLIRLRMWLRKNGYRISTQSSPTQ